MKLRKIISVILSIALLLSVIGIVAAANGSGDVNGDGKVNTTDARQILRWSAKLDKLDENDEVFAIADMNGDGKVNSLDARLALRAAAKIPDASSEPVETTVYYDPAKPLPNESQIEYAERVGCRYCGSHSCVSFYCVDEWGNEYVDPEKCPQYDITKDPTEYCQICHMQIGVGLDKCCSFLHDTYCPRCGQFSKAHECHHCPGSK